MGRREKNIEITAEDKVINKQQVTEYSCKKRVIGTVQEVNKRFLATRPSGESFKAQTPGEALDYLIREFHLHFGG